MQHAHETSIEDEDAVIAIALHREPARQQKRQRAVTDQGDEVGEAVHDYVAQEPGCGVGRKGCGRRRFPATCKNCFREVANPRRDFALRRAHSASCSTTCFLTPGTGAITATELEPGRKRMPSWARRPSQNPCTIFFTQANFSDPKSKDPQAWRSMWRTVERLVPALGYSHHAT